MRASSTRYDKRVTTLSGCTNLRQAALLNFQVIASAGCHKIQP
jgi:hypothetical protein